MNCRIQFALLALCRFFFLSPFFGSGDRVSTIVQAGIGTHHVRQAGLWSGGNSPALDSKVLGIEVPVLSFFISCSAVSRDGSRASCMLSKCSLNELHPQPSSMFYFEAGSHKAVWPWLTLETRQGLNFWSSCLSLPCSRFFLFRFVFVFLWICWCGQMINTLTEFWIVNQVHTTL